MGGGFIVFTFSLFFGFPWEKKLRKEKAVPSKANESAGHVPTMFVSYNSHWRILHMHVLVDRPDAYRSQNLSGGISDLGDKRSTTAAAGGYILDYMTSENTMHSSAR